MPLELVLADKSKIIALPCPFCGSDNIDIDCSADDGVSFEEADSAWLHCQDCFCQGPMANIGCRDEDDGVDLEKEAHELWNKRALVSVARVQDVAHPSTREAIKYVLHRIQEDPNVGYYCGPGTQVFHLLTKAESELDNRPLADVETERRRSTTPAHREQRPDVEILRNQLEELRQ